MMVVKKKSVKKKKRFSTSKKQLIESERENLFWQMWRELVKEEQELDRDFNVARNLAASRWDVVMGRLSPVQIDPEQLDLLQENFHLLQEEISRKKYYLIKAFSPWLSHLTGDQKACCSYWEEELAKSNPNLTNRFKEELND